MFYDSRKLEQIKTIGIFEFSVELRGKNRKFGSVRIVKQIGFHDELYRGTHQCGIVKTQHTFKNVVSNKYYKRLIIIFSRPAPYVLFPSYKRTARIADSHSAGPILCC